MLLNFDKKNPIHNYINLNHQRMLDELVDWLKIPSISADSSCNQEVRNAAIKTQSLLNEAGVNETGIIETKGHPIVYGEHIIDTNAPTVLVYGHYDVQPATPLELWDSPPFEPVIKEGKIYARGAADDKGQVMMHIKAFELMKKLDLISCNIKFLIEGEEEVGSDNLNAFVSQHKKKLACDVILISDTSMIALDTPSITVGLKGLCYMEVTLTGPNIDLHSGVYGGTVANPANVLCDIISQLKDKDGKITIPGFYDKVVDLSDAEREALNRTPFNLNEFKKSLDIAQEEGEKGYTTVERAGIRPTLDVNGMWSGYIGEGAKTVLPSKASAKISMRLVPNQDEEEIATLFQTYFKSLLPASVKAEILVHHGGPPYVTPIEGKAYQAASAAIQESFGKKVIPTRDGGSIPIVAHFSNELQADTVLLGMGLDSDAIHSPNEKFELNNFYMGIATIPLFYKYFAKS